MSTWRSSAVSGTAASGLTSPGLSDIGCNLVELLGRSWSLRTSMSKWAWPHRSMLLRKFGKTS
jgi:hypothetical protein